MEKQNRKASTCRSIILEIDEAKAGIINAVNASLKRGLPCYIVADILDNIRIQMREGARKELEAARLQEQNTQIKEDMDNG